MTRSKKLAISVRKYGNAYQNAQLLEAADLLDRIDALEAVAVAAKEYLNGGDYAYGEPDLASALRALQEVPRG